MHKDIYFKLLRGRSGLETLESGWQRLQARDSNTTFYQTYEWFASVVEFLLADDDECLFVTAEAEQELVGVFPLQIIRSVHYGVPFWSLVFPQHRHVNECDFLVHPAMYDVGLFSQLIEFLHGCPEIRWDMLQLERSPLGSCSDRLATEQKIPLGRSAISGSISEIDCESPEKSSLVHLAGRFRRNLARLERRAARHGELSHVSYFGGADVEEGLCLFVDIENDGWKGAAGSSVASAANLQQFYVSLAVRFAGEPRCCINVLRIGKETVAANFGIISSGTYFILKIGFRQRFAELGPGNLLLASTIRHFSRDPDVNTINLVTSPEWAEKWKTNANPLCTHTVFRSSLKGHVLCMMMWAKERLNTLKQGREHA